jgi:hypothetical protein
MRIVYLGLDLQDRGTGEPVGGLAGGPEKVARSGILRRGEAGLAWIASSGELESEARLVISENSTHAMLGHGVVEAINRLAIEGRLGSGLEVMIPPSVCEPVRSLFYEADRLTYGGRHEFVVGDSEGNPPTQYRVRIDNTEYQRTLAGLQFLMTTASRSGRAAWIRI